MKKYVYDLTKFLTKEELIEELKNINYINPKKEEILSSYNIDYENMDIDDIETTIRVNNYRKHLEVVFSLFDFTILDTNNVGENTERKKQSLMNLLSWNGIDLIESDIYELGRVIEILKTNKTVLEELDRSYIDKYVLLDTFSKINVETDNNTIQNILKLINNLTFQQATYLPVIRNKYYDESNNIFYTVEVLTDDKDADLKSFKGEIFESLKFNNDEEAREYEKKHNITETLDSEIKTYIHFKGEEDNDTWHKEMHIIKQKNSTVVKYGDNYTFINENNNSINERELENIMEFLKQKTPNNEFLKYVIKELKSLKKVIEQRNYVRKDQSIDKESLKNISSIISDDNYGEDRNIYFKSKIISSEPLIFKKEKTLKK